jgi:hypothetical protein
MGQGSSCKQNTTRTWYQQPENRKGMPTAARVGTMLQPQGVDYTFACQSSSETGDSEQLQLHASWLTPQAHLLYCPSLHAAALLAAAAACASACCSACTASAAAEPAIQQLLQFSI